MAGQVLSHRLSAVDAAFLYTEHTTAPMHIGSVDVLEGALEYGAFVEDIDSKLHLLPRYRQRVVTPPLYASHPTWEDDPEFDIHNHIVAVKLPKPGTETQLRRLAGRLFEGMLPRDRPLWKLYLVDGLKGGNTGLVSLVHHCMVDGVSGVELMTIILDPTPNPPQVEPVPYTPEPLPSIGKQIADGLWANVANALANWSEFQANLADWAKGIRGSEFAAIIKDIPGLARDFSKLPVNLPFNTRDLSGKRKLSWSSCSFAEARGIRSACGGTVNDVVLATLGGAVRRYMDLHAIPVKRRTLRVMAPVSLRREDERSALGNRVSMLPVDVPLWYEDPVERLKAITERTSVLKKVRVAEGLHLATHLWQSLLPSVQHALASAAFAPALQPLLSLALRAPALHMVCTNVPGPQIALYALGHKVLAHYPLLPVVPGMGLSMGVFSYNQRLHFGFIADTHAAPDVTKFNAYLDEAFIELREAAGVAVAEHIEVKSITRASAPKTAAAKRASQPANSNGSAAEANATRRRKRSAASRPSGSD